MRSSFCAQVMNIADALPRVRTLCLHGCHLSRMELAAISDALPRVHMTLLPPARRACDAMSADSVPVRDNA
jgi:hypothetical protein